MGRRMELMDARDCQSSAICFTRILEQRRCFVQCIVSMKQGEASR